MTPQQFIAKWQRANLSERSGAHQHFCDPCDLLGQPKPAAADPDGAWYTFERGVRTSLAPSPPPLSRKGERGEETEEHQGWADVWMRGHFGWEYKGKRKSLDDA